MVIVSVAGSLGVVTPSVGGYAGVDLVMLEWCLESARKESRSGTLGTIADSYGYLKVSHWQTPHRW